MSRSDDHPSLSDALAALPAAVKALRTARRVSLRDAAEEIGIPFHNLYQLEKGGNCTLRTVIACALWLEAS